MWNATSHYAIGDQVQLGGNIYRAIAAITATNPSTDYAHWELNYVRANTTLIIGVGQTFPTLTAAWTYAINARVADGSYLHFAISTSNGPYNQNFAAPFLLDHASGPRIAIIGDSLVNISLTFSSPNGLVIDSTHSLNTLANIRVIGTNLSAQTCGLKANSGATVSSISNVEVHGFQTGVQSTQGASISIDSLSTIETPSTTSSICCDAETGGSIVFPDGGTIAGGGAGTGLYAAFGGQIKAEGSTIGYYTDGAEAVDGGLIDVGNSTISHCEYGCESSLRGYAKCPGSTFASNTWDLEVIQGGLIYAGSATYGATFIDSGLGSVLVP
jgi:hypothetical protein